jgi:hypothetical protein
MIVDNDSNDLNAEEGIIEFNFTLTSECYWRITWYAVDLLGNTELLHVQYHIVDNTPPHVIILKPTDGWYSEGSVIPSVVLSEDLTSIHSQCGMCSDCAVGIANGQQGKAWLIDIFPEFRIIELDTTNFKYKASSHEYIGNVKIPIGSNLTDGAYLFIAGSEDRLGNDWTSIHELIHAYIIQGLTECNSESCIMEFLGDVLADFIADRNIVFVGIDVTPPEVEFDESEETGAPIPDVIYPGVIEIKANITDVLSGITAGSPCYIKLNGITLGTLPYDKFTDSCHGWIIVPNVLPNMQDVPLSIEVYDDVGNKGIDTVIVDYVNTLSNIIPTVRIESPDDNTTHAGTLTFVVSAHDDTTPTKDIKVKVLVLREDDPALVLYATYDNVSGNFILNLDISEYQNGAQLVLKAYAIDKDGYSGNTEPRTYWVESNICYDQWMHNGWNLMNLYCVCEDRTVSGVLQSIDGLYDMVYEVGTGHIWIEGYSTIDLMTEGTWYWVHMNNTQDRFYMQDCEVQPEEPSNTAPVANDDYASVCISCGIYSVDIDVLQNDTDSDGDTITLFSFDATSDKGGSIVRNDSGTPSDLSDDTLIYTPPTYSVNNDDPETIIDSFEYRIYDGIDGYDEAVVYVTIEYSEPY